MIRINLLGEKKDTSATNVIQIGIYCGAVLASLLFCFLAYQTTAAEVDELTQEKARVEQELKVLEKKTAEVKDLEQKKTVLREKLSAIAQLKAKKHGPVHVLSDISTAVPELSWLDLLKEKDGVLELKGIALDNPTIAVFMGELAKSKYFSSVDLIQSRSYVKDDAKLKEFSLAVKLQDPLAVTNPNVQPANAQQTESKPDLKPQSK